MASDTPLTPGRRQQMPRTFRSTLTPHGWRGTGAWQILWILQGVDLGHDQPRAVRSGHLDLAVDQFGEASSEIRRRDGQAGHPVISDAPR